MMTGMYGFFTQRARGGRKAVMSVTVSGFAGLGLAPPCGHVTATPKQKRAGIIEG